MHLFKPFVCLILSSNHARQTVFGYHSRLALAACTSTRPAKANASRLHEHIVHFTVLLKCISQSFLSSSPWHYRTRTSEIVHLRISFDQNHCCEWIRNENSLAVSTVTIGTALIGHTISVNTVFMSSKIPHYTILFLWRTLIWLDSPYKQGSARWRPPVIESLAICLYTWTNWWVGRPKSFDFTTIVPLNKYIHS